MPQRSAFQSVAKEVNSNQHGVSAATDEGEVLPRVLRLISTEIGPPKHFRDASPRDGEDNTAFYSISQSRQLGATSRKMEEEVAHTILTRQQRSHSVGSANTCYVVHDTEGKPVLRLVSNGFAITRKLGGTTILPEPSQSSGNSSRNVSKDGSTMLHDNEEIVLMLGDSTHGGRSVARVIRLEKEEVGRTVEHCRPLQQYEISTRRRRKKRPPVYSTDNQEYEGDEGSFRRHSRRERRDSKDSNDSLEERESHTQLNRASVASVTEYRAERGSVRHKNQNLPSRSRMYRLKSEELLSHRTSINRSAKFGSGKDSSQMTSYEETTQEPHSSVSVEIALDSVGQEENVSATEEEDSEKETQDAAAKPGAKGKKKGGKKEGGKDTSKEPESASEGDTAQQRKASTASVSAKKEKRKSSVSAASGKDRRKSSVAEGKKQKKASISQGPASETASGAPASEVTEGADDKPQGQDKKAKQQKKKKSVSKGGEAQSADDSAAPAVSEQPTLEAVSEPTEGQTSDVGIFDQQNLEGSTAEQPDKKGKRKKSKTGLENVTSEKVVNGRATPVSVKPLVVERKKSATPKRASVRGSIGGTSAAKEKTAKEKADKKKEDKEKKDKGKRKASKETLKEEDKTPEKTPSEDAGLVQGLQIEETPTEPVHRESPVVLTPVPSQETPKTPPTTDVSYQGEESQQPTTDRSHETAHESPRPEETPRPAETESEVLGTIVYQHVARYVCIGMLRVAGGVRVLFDAAERQSYVQVISPLCEAYVTYYVNNMTFLTSTSAAGVAFAAVIHRKKNGGAAKENTASSNGKPMKERDRYSEQEMATRHERCRLPEACKSVVDTAHVVFCDPYQAQRFKTVLETLKSAAECSNCLITPCMPSGNPIGFPCPPVVPCAIVDPLNVQRACPPPLPPPCCSIPFCPPNQFQQPPCQSMSFGNNPCLGSQIGQQQNLCSQQQNFSSQQQNFCSQQQNMFPLQCPDAFAAPNPFPSLGQISNQSEFNNQSVQPSPATQSPQTPSWSPYPSPYTPSYPAPNTPQNNPQQMPYGNELMSEPPSPFPYSPYPDQGMGRGRIRFNPNVTVFQPEKLMGRPEDMMRPNCYAQFAATQMECYDPYSYENCCGKTLFCAPACLVRLNSDMGWIDVQKGCLKIFQCPNNGGYSLVLENADKAITTHHYLTADTVFVPSEKTQFGFTYTTVTRSENRGTFIDHFLVSFMSLRAAEQFKCCVDNIKAILEASSDEWAGTKCPSKSNKPWQ